MSSDTILQNLFSTVETRYGKVRGIINGGVHGFQGVPYGDDTGGPARFQPPRPPKPWVGVRDCFGPGHASPQVPTPIGHTYAQLIYFDRAVSECGMSEDCLHLSVWTPGVNDGGKRPIRVSLHGGGFAISSGSAALYDGAQLASGEDVVVVSVTHRLASFGYLGLQGLGADERFDTAGVSGILDLVQALQWVRDHAETFGGDADRVMIFGQSGGGWKTSMLLAAPAARGLFHRAAVQSGSWNRVLTEDEGASLALALLNTLGLGSNEVARLVDLPFDQILAAQSVIGALAFSPVLNETALPHQPLDPAALDFSRDIPVIISTMLDDAGLFLDSFSLDEEGLKAVLSQTYGDRAGELLALYRRHYPAKSAYLLHAQMVTDAGFRRLADTQAEARVRHGAPVWRYQWDWPSPAWDGLFGAAHAMDVSATFNNVRDPLLGAGHATGRKLAGGLSSAFARFAATGDPQTPKLPAWPRFRLEDRACLILDENPHVASDPNPALRAFWNTLPPPVSVLG